MIIQLTHNNKQYQAYKEISIAGNVIIEIFELIKFNQGFNHKYICSHAVNLKWNTEENDSILIKESEELIKQL